MNLIETMKKVADTEKRTSKLKNTSNQMAVDQESRTVDYLRVQDLLKESEQKLLEIQKNCNHATYAEEWAQISNNPNDWRNKQSINGVCLACGKKNKFVQRDKAIIISNGYNGEIFADYFNCAKHLFEYLMKIGKSENKAFAYTETILQRLYESGLIRGKTVCYDEVIKAAQPIISESDGWAQQRHMESEKRIAEINLEMDKWPDWKKDHFKTQSPVKTIDRKERSKVVGSLSIK